LRELGKESPVYSDPAKSIEVTNGQEFSIELDANATTGYQWQLAEPLNNSLLELLSTEYRVSETGLVGAGGKEIWKFRAVDQGKTMISMKYIRPWEKGTPPVKNVQFQVVIYH
jgi:inhibitor of cysteine peptidase